MKGILFTILFALVFGGGGTFLWLYYGGFHGEDGEAIAFIDKYGDYNEIATEVEFLVHLPGTENNADRAELLALLETILTEDITNNKRKTLARLAFANIDNLKKEIDAAQIKQAELYEVLQDLDNSSRQFSSIDLRNRSSDIVTLSRKRAEIAARITSILSEINEHSYAIITRILSDNGELTQEHIIAINNITTDAENRFDTLEELYNDLIRMKNEIDEAFKEFAAAAL